MSKRGTLAPEAGAACRRLLAGEASSAGLAIVPLAAPVAAQPLVGDGSVTCGSVLRRSPAATPSAGWRSAPTAIRMLYGFIADANWDALGGDPESIAVGMSLMIPCIDASGQVLTPEEAAEAAASIEAAVAAEGPLTPAAARRAVRPGGALPRSGAHAGARGRHLPARRGQGRALRRGVRRISPTRSARRRRPTRPGTTASASSPRPSRTS